MPGLHDWDSLLVDGFAWNGHWWRASDIAKKLPGTLTWQPKSGITLELLSTFPGGEGNHPIDRISAIHGTTAEAEHICLLDCRNAGSSRDARGTYRSRYMASWVITGAYHRSQDDACVDEMNITLSTLDSWLLIPRFKEPEGVRFPQPCTVTLAPYRAISLGEIAGCQVDLFVGWTMSTTGPGQTLEIGPSSHLRLSCRESLPLTEWLPYLRQLRDFMTFVSRIRTNVGRISCKALTCDGMGFERPYELICADLTGAREGESYASPLVVASGVLGSLGVILNNWFKKSNVLQAVYDLCLSTIYHSEMRMENKFLNLVLGLEAFHRRVYDATLLPPEEHMARVRRVLHRADKSDKNFLKWRLRYSNEPPLKNRLKQLLEEPDVAGLLKIEQPGDFIDAVCDTRNFFVHRDKRLASRALCQDRMHHVIRQLAGLLQCSILRQLGLTTSQLRAAGGDSLLMF